MEPRRTLNGPAWTLTNPDGRVAVIGLGYVGLQLALAFARAGRVVVGFGGSSESAIDQRLDGSGNR